MTRKRKRRKHTAGGSRLQIKTTASFAGKGLPLEQLGDVAEMLQARHRKLVSQLTYGFVPVPFDRYVDLHVRANPTVDRGAFALQLRKVVDARKAGARCACGAFIWAIGSADAGAACFTCITGEAWPDGDYEIDEALGAPPG